MIIIECILIIILLPIFMYMGFLAFGKNMIRPEDLAKSGTEHGEQAALFCWSSLPEIKAKYPQLKWLHSIPNGFFSSSGQKGKEKAAGLKSGVPDICLPIVKRSQMLGIGYCALYIELKIPSKKNINNPLAGTSDEQQEWIAHLLNQGYAVHVAYGWEDARRIIVDYLEGR